jgi:DNA gyrase subunit A
VVQTELEELSAQFPDRRRTSLGSADEVVEYDPQTYIVRENTNVVLTRDGWIKRVGRLQNVETTRVREGDSVLAVVPGSTLEHVVVFSSEGVAYTLPMDQVPASTGYGEPLAKHVRLGDGAKVVAAVTTDPRFTPPDKAVRRQPTPSPCLLIATRMGQIMQISLSHFRTPSTKAGRKYCRLRSGDRVVYVGLVTGAETMFLATAQARVLHFAISEVPILSAAGKGVRGIKLESGDEVLGAVQLGRVSDCLRVLNTAGTQMTFGQTKYGVASRGGKGVKTSTRNGFAEIIQPPIELVDWDAIGE